MVYILPLTKKKEIEIEKNQNKEKKVMIKIIAEINEIERWHTIEKNQFKKKLQAGWGKKGEVDGVTGVKYRGGWSG